MIAISLDLYNQKTAVEICYTIKAVQGKVKGLGYCNKHYIRYKKYGNPLLVNGREVME